MKTIKITDNGKLKTSKLLAKCKKLFPVWSWYSDKQLDEDFPPVKTSYEYEMTQEPSEEFTNKSANDLAKEYPDKHFITLRERILMELEYFEETGEHLDIKNLTLCAGSRYSDGLVPGCHLGGDGHFYVGCCYPGSADDNLRARVAVSLDTLPLDTLENRVKELENKMDKISKMLII